MLYRRRILKNHEYRKLSTEEPHHGKRIRMEVGGPGIGKEYKPDECVKEGQGKGQMNKNYLLDLFLGLFVRSVSSEDLIRESRTSLPATHLHHVISEPTF